MFLYKFNDFEKNGGWLIYPNYLLESKDYLHIKIIDKKTKKFRVPDSWFVIDTRENTSYVFISKNEYLNFLNKNNISGKTYNTEKMHKQFLDTGILPWFPDSVKKKLTN